MLKELQITQTITPRDSHALASYLKDIQTTQPLTPDEEVELAVRIQHGDMQARNELVRANLRFVISVAKSFQRSGVELADLISEGNIGLITAAERFDPTYGFKFDSYAIWWIRQSIMRALDKVTRAVHVPSNVASQMSKLRKAQAAFEQKNERLPTADELSEMVDIQGHRIQEIQDAYYRAMSLDAPITDDGDSTWADIFPSYEAADDKMMQESQRLELEQLISTLPERERLIIELSYGLNGDEQSMDMIAYQLQLTRERVRQLREKALRTLRLKLYYKHHRITA